MYDIITGWNPIRLYDQYVAQVIVSILTYMYVGILYNIKETLGCSFSVKY